MYIRSMIVCLAPSLLRGNRKESQDLSSWIVRALVVEICRFLHGDKLGVRLPLRLFLSHAKQDIDNAPQVFNEVMEHLKTSEPVEAWVDSAKISAFIAHMLIVFPWLRSLTSLVSWVLETTTSEQHTPPPTDVKRHAVPPRKTAPFSG